MPERKRQDAGKGGDGYWRKRRGMLEEVWEGGMRVGEVERVKGKKEGEKREKVTENRVGRDTVRGMGRSKESKRNRKSKGK